MRGRALRDSRWPADPSTPRIALWVSGSAPTGTLASLVGDGCKITDTPTVECTLAPMASNGAVTLKVRASTNRVLLDGQNEVTRTLRTRIYGIRESDTANNWKDTPLRIVR